MSSVSARSCGTLGLRLALAQPFDARSACGLACDQQDADVLEIGVPSCARSLYPFGAGGESVAPGLDVESSGASMACSTPWRAPLERTATQAPVINQCS